jgi:hypothetical protein
MRNQFVNGGTGVCRQKKIAAERNPIQSSIKQASINGSLSFGDADPQIEIIQLLLLIANLLTDKNRSAVQRSRMVKIAVDRQV